MSSILLFKHFNFILRRIRLIPQIHRSFNLFRCFNDFAHRPYHHRLASEAFLPTGGVPRRSVEAGFLRH